MRIFRPCDCVCQAGRGSGLLRGCPPGGPQPPVSGRAGPPLPIQKRCHSWDITPWPVDFSAFQRPCAGLPENFYGSGQEQGGWSALQRLKNNAIMQYMVPCDCIYEIFLEQGQPKPVWQLAGPACGSGPYWEPQVLAARRIRRRRTLWARSVRHRGSRGKTSAGSKTVSYMKRAAPVRSVIRRGRSAAQGKKPSARAATQGCPLTRPGTEYAA